MTAQARDIAAKGGVAWCVLVVFGDEDKSYNGPVTFSPATVGYYVEELDDGANEALEDDIGDMLSSVISGCNGVKITLTDFDPDEFEDRNIIFSDFGDGTLA